MISLDARFGKDVMETMVQFTMTQIRAAFGDTPEAEVSILDIGTGNGVLPLELASQGFAEVTGAGHTPSCPSLTRMATCAHGAARVQCMVYSKSSSRVWRTRQ